MDTKSPANRAMLLGWVSIAPLGLWWGAICLDSVFLFPWNVADLPPSVKPYANQIFGSLFGSGAAVGAFQAIGSAIGGWGRRR